MSNVFLIAILVARLVWPSASDVCYLLLAVYAFSGRAQLIKALLTSWILTMLNPALAQEASGGVGKYLVILGGAGSAVFHNISRNRGFGLRKMSAYTGILGVFMLVHSVFFSVVPEVSLLKSVSWLLVIMTLLSAWNGIAIQEREVLFAEINWILILLLLCSLPFLFIPEVGYLLNGTGFQGVMSHPQAFGPTAALTGVLVGGRILGGAKPGWRDIGLFCLCVVLVVLSEARTAGVAMALGLMLSSIISPILAGTSFKKMLPGLRSRRLGLIAILSIIPLMLAGPFLSEKISDYLLKRSDSTNIVAAADVSRGALITRMFSNIQENPWQGIGLGVASDPSEMLVERDPFFGLPLSAAVEKGVMPIAVLEELGVLGALGVAAWIGAILVRGARAGVQKFAVLMTLLLVNLGESMLFSAGGMGLLLIILLTGAVAGDGKKTGGPR